MKSMRTLFSAVLCLALSSPLAAQDKPRTRRASRKRATPSCLKGCLRGAALEATDVGAEDSSTPLLSGLTFRLTGKKDLLKEMKQKHDGRIVEVRGTLKSDLQPPGRIRNQRRRDAHHHRRSDRRTCRRA